MPAHDVVVIGAGLAGLTAAAELAEAGARVFLTAGGMATTHWSHGGLDVAALPGVATSRQGVARLAEQHEHPYALLAGEVEPALDAQLRRLDDAGLGYRGDLDSPLMPIPTPIGGLRAAAILPEAQAAAAVPWGADEGLLILGFGRFKDFWPQLMARNLARAWREGGPSRVRVETVELPDFDRLRNLGPIDAARAFDDGGWRQRALPALARATPRGSWRVALPAVLGLSNHAEAYAAVAGALGHPVFEVSTPPSSIPGTRLFEALRGTILRAGGRLQVGMPVIRAERSGRRVDAVHTEAAARTLRLSAERFVLATGGIAGGGLRATRDGRIEETVFGLPVEAPPRADWFGPSFGSHPLERAGLRTDHLLRPLDASGSVELENVHVAGSLLAGMRYLTERCGDGVALASGRAAAGIGQSRDHPARMEASA